MCPHCGVPLRKKRRATLFLGAQSVIAALLLAGGLAIVMRAGQIDRWTPKGYGLMFFGCAWLALILIAAAASKR